MKLVIDIKEEVYKSIQDNDYCGISNADMYNAIKNGIPLPEKVYYPQVDGVTPTIIEVDKESEK